MKRILLFLFLTIATALAQESQPAAPGIGDDSALGVRQQRVKRLMLDLERKFTELAGKLEAEQPEQAKKLTEAFQRSKELLMQQRMDEVTKLLNSQKLESASEEQDKIVGDIKNLISILLEEEDELEKMKNKIRELEEMKQQLADIIRKENELKDDSATIADKEGKLEELDAQIAKAEDLMRKQEALKEKTAEEATKGLDKVEKLAKEQAELKEQTEQLAEEVAGDSDKKPASKDGEEPPSQKPGAESLKKAAKDQERAEDRLAAGQAKEAEKSESDAIEDLERALEELKEERERVAGLDPEEKSTELAQEQDKTASETGDLAQEMAGGKPQPPQEGGEPKAGGEPKEGGEPQDPQEGGEPQEPQEGGEPQEPQEESAEQKAAESMKKAQESMGKAAQKLGEQKPEEAEEDQEDALEELEEAFEQLEEEIEEMKQDIQEQQIAQLEAIFSEMLERQKKLTKDTADLDHRRVQEGQEKLARADRVQLRNLSRDEKELSGTAAEAEQLLTEEGTSIVVLSVVTELKNALGDVGELMDDSKTGEFVQRSQKEIELTLEELIEAMKQAQNQKQQEQQQQQPPPGQKPPPLLPPAAELRMLKLSQLRVNRRTVDFDDARIEAGKLDEKMLQLADDLAAFQAKVTVMAREVAAMGQARNPAEVD